MGMQNSLTQTGMSSSHGIVSGGYLGGDKGTTAASDNISQEPALLDEILDTKPQLLYTKFQRLSKDHTKLAKVVVVDEVP